MTHPIVSVLMLTFNAPAYVERSVRSVAASTEGVDFELVVLDNASDSETRDLVQHLHGEGLIGTLKLLDYNSLFAAGNNIAATLAREDATHFLLLNSDVEVRSSDWLSHLLSVHKLGITSYGIAANPPTRADGYCLLIDADLYRAHPLDEHYQWFYGVSKQQAELLHAGYSVQGYSRHDDKIVHFGGKSGSAYQGANGMDVRWSEVRRWFRGNTVNVLDANPDGSIPGYTPATFGARVKAKARSLANGALNWD